VILEYSDDGLEAGLCFATATNEKQKSKIAPLQKRIAPSLREEGFRVLGFLVFLNPNCTL
jgi:hypothetical protein